MAMKESFEEIYDTKDQAERAGLEYAKWIGYQYKIEELNGKYKLFLWGISPTMG